MSGCGSGETADHAAERTIVADFFAALATGETANIVALLTDDSALSSAVLDADFYGAAVAAPTDAKVTAASEFETGVIYVTVEYAIGGEDRDIKVAVVESDGEPKIDSWLNDTLSLDPLRAPGVWEVNGSFETGELEKSTQFVALPGIYEFEYVDHEGLGTVDPEGAAAEAFEVEFPVNDAQLSAAVPTGVASRGSSIGAEPRLLSAVDDEVESQLAMLVDECSASGLVGDSCPADLVAEAGTGGALDTNTIVWTDNSTDHIAPSADWNFLAEFTVAFNRLDAAGRSTVDASFTGVVTSDGKGEPVLELAG